ncbi:MAG: lysylphosphatidylglycerol synthase transmembrane domain-containing protein [Bacilli bacterium]|jgi:uncharacterized protein (TIRG00374 family)
MTIEENQQRLRKKRRKNIFNMVFVLVVAIVAIYLTLKDNYQEVYAAFMESDWRFIVIILAVIFLYFSIDGFIFFILARLYTTRYKWHRGLAVTLIGAFHAGISPSNSGGQFAQAATMKRQKIDISSAASILVMYFIIYQIVLVCFGVVAIIFKFDILIKNAEPISLFGINVQVWLLALIGFLFNGIVISTLLLLSNSKPLHNFIINKGIGFFGKIKLVRQVDRTRARVRIAVENFRIELRRLQSNVPVLVLLLLLFSLRFLALYSIPYLVGRMMMLPMNTYIIEGAYVVGKSLYADTVFLNSFLQMITGILPLPGGAGVSEYFYERLFASVYLNPTLTEVSLEANIGYLHAGQILWRFITFYFGLLVGGAVTAFYRSSMEKEIDAEFASKTFAEIKAETMATRTATSETMVNTSTLSVQEIRRKLTGRRDDEP